MIMKTRVLLILILLAPAIPHKAFAAQGRQTWCNPMDIDYKYNFEQLSEQISYRSAAGDQESLLHIRQGMIISPGLLFPTGQGPGISSGTPGKENCTYPPAHQ